MSSENSSESFGKEQGLRLKSIRQELGLTPELAAIQGNVSSQQWRKYERGEAEPKISKMLFLFREGYSLNWIMTGTGPKRLSGITSQDQAANPKGIIEEWVQYVREKEGGDGRIVMELSVQVAEFRKWYQEKKSNSTFVEENLTQKNVA